MFAVKESLIVDFVAHPAGRAPDGGTCDQAYCTAGYDFRLVRAPT